MKIPLVLAVLLFGARLLAADVSLTINGAPARPGDLKPAEIQALVLENGLLRLTFGRDVNGDFSAVSVMKGGQELAHNLHGVEPRDVDAKRTFYLDSGAGRDHLVTDIVRIVKVTPELAHFAVIDNRALHLEHHFVMLRGESGVHPYVIVKSAPGANTGETRTMYRFDMDILDWAWSGERTGKQPKYAVLQAISPSGNMGDETWRLADGSVYQKYDYSPYYAETDMWGHYGHGFGVFFIPVSLESYAGGPLRQELAVHQDALILNYIGGGHFGGGGTAAGRNGEKIHGPWYLYFNSGESNEAVIADAKKVAAAEKSKWPYRWMEEPLYPVRRTMVHGELKVSHGRSAAGAYVILGQPTNPTRGGGGGAPGGKRGGGGGATGGTPPVEDRASILYTQAGDYLFFAKADAEGKFTLPAVRPGTYTLYAWQTQGPITQSLAVDNVVVKGDVLDLGGVQWDPPYRPTLLFQVGQADRMAGEFKLGHAPRSNQLTKEVPANLTFTVGKSREAEDWYYTQHSGTWTIAFEVAQVPTEDVFLTIPVAGGPGNVTVRMNGTEVGKIVKGDDASVRRAANRSGVYARYEFKFAASLLKAGANAVTFEMPTRGGRGGGGTAGEGPTGQQAGSAANNGIMYDTVVLEAN